MSQHDPTDPWKEQLGYVSGTVLVWGALLVQLWPIVARMQIGRHVKLIPETLFKGPSLPELSYRVAAIALALGMGMVFFGTLHAVARGLWLAQYSEQEDADGFAVVDRLAFRTYVILQFYWLIVALVVFFAFPLVAFLTVVQSFLMSHLGWSETWSSIIPSIIVTVVVLALGVFILRHRLDTIVQFAKLVSKIEYFIALFALLVFGSIAIEFCYTVELQLEHRVFRQSDKSPMIVSAFLGGAVSDPAYARFHLRGPGDRVQALPMRALGDGTYVTTLQITDLAPGNYDISLDYPHASVLPIIPFVRPTLERHLGFQVIP